MTWLTIVGMAVVTFFNRYLFIARFVRYTPGTRVTKFLGYSSFAVLTAIWTPIVFELSPEVGVAVVGWDYLVATIIAASLSLARLPSLLVVVASVGVFFVLRWVGV